MLPQGCKGSLSPSTPLPGYDLQESERKNGNEESGSGSEPSSQRREINHTYGTETPPCPSTRYPGHHFPLLPHQALVLESWTMSRTTTIAIRPALIGGCYLTYSLSQMDLNRKLQRNIKYQTSRHGLRQWPRQPQNSPTSTPTPQAA